MNSIYSSKTLNRVKLWCTVTFMRYLARAVSLIFLPKTLIWNKITFPRSNSLNFPELLKNELMKSTLKKFTTIPFSIQFIATYCKDFKN